MTLLITPFWGIDAINLPKFLVLAGCSICILGLLVNYLSGYLRNQFRRLSVGVLSFVLFTILTFVANSSSSAQFFGAFGRNTGLVAYLGLAIVLLASAIVGRKSFGRKALYALILVSLFNMGYGFVQISGRDPIEWPNLNNPIIGTLGNTNFYSALLGIGAVAVFALILEGGTILSRLSWGVALAGMLFISYESEAIQGLGVFLIGAVIVFYYRFLTGRSIFISGSYLVLVSIVFVVSVFGTLRKGPLSGLLYQESVTYRGDYWSAGWEMTKANPLLGVGMDGYGDWYRASRTESAALRRGPDVTTNSAHNVFLDISSNGGFLLLFAYLLILGLALRSSILILKRSKGFDFVAVGLVSCWVGYLAQSTVSINQLGLAVWGWVFSGAIIGYQVYGDEELPVPKSQRQMIPLNAFITGSLGLIIGFAVSAGPMIQDVTFRSALESLDGLKIKSAALQWPANTYYMDYAADILLQNKLNDLALELSRESVAKNPRNFNGWKLLFSNPSATPAELDQALAKMRELDPFNNTLPES